MTPGKGGTVDEGFQVWNTIDEAVREAGADCALIFVPPAAAADAIMEAAARLRAPGRLHHRGHSGAGHGPGQAFPSERPKRLLGPNCPGLITPGQGKIGIMPGHIHEAGVGIVSRSGTLTYEAVRQLSNLGLGQSTCVGIGGDPVNGTTSSTYSGCSRTIPRPRRS